MKQHDFKAAFKALKRLTGRTFTRHEQAHKVNTEFFVNHAPTLLQALNLADKVTDDPSDEMVKAALDRDSEDEGMIYEGIFKAMIEQAVREIE